MPVPEHHHFVVDLVSLNSSFLFKYFFGVFFSVLKVLLLFETNVLKRLFTVKSDQLT